MEDISVGFIGFGLIGGSIARALRAKYPNTQIIAFNHHGNSKNKGLELAYEDGTLDMITVDLEKDFKDLDLIFLCGPVLSNIKYLSRLKGIIKPSSILTDVGSVKGNIHESVKELGLEKHFIGGHPMTGSEKTGYEASSQYLLENAFYILTPTDETPKENITFMENLVTALGSIAITLDYNTHDDITAAISHVPHILASALTNMVRTNDNADENMRNLAAGGFKDMTRIASSSPIMWQNICLTNPKSIRNFLHIYQQQISTIMDAIERGDEKFLFDFFSEAKEYRDSIPNKSTGAISKVFEVYMDILDETGAIATVATILASNSISIKNIGIIHNREFEEGVLRIELYEQKSMDKTVELLSQYHYTIYER